MYEKAEVSHVVNIVNFDVVAIGRTSISSSMTGCTYDTIRCDTIAEFIHYITTNANRYKLSYRIVSYRIGV